MSYEDLEEARAKRAEKEAAKEAKGKGKRRRKPKGTAPEVEEAFADKGKRGRKAQECCDRTRCARAEGQGGPDERSVRASDGPSRTDDRPSGADDRSARTSEGSSGG
jgi:hypothetical protein